MASRLRLLLSLALALLVGAPGFVTGQPSATDEEARLAFFEKKVRPVLVANCYNCHSANTNSRGGLRVDDRNGLLAGGDRGPAVVPGHPDKSLLIQAVRHTHAEVKMPPKQQLAEEQIADLTRWIQDGAAWPRASIPLSIGKDRTRYARLRKEHWAWQPLREPTVPAVKNAAWPRNDIDRFLLAALEAKGLQPVPDADPLTLLRRITFDLTGLPPTPQQMSNLRFDIDDVLASSAYGERWGRHWLDVARYGESTGSSRNVAYPHAWRYRDYVIDSFNHDKPYNQFVREQIAGDLLPGTGSQRDEMLIATGFLALGVCDVNQRFKVRFVMDNIDEQIDTVGRAILGLTVSCARCHDHKFDPIPTTDYYALAGIFHSSDRCTGVRNKMGGGGLDFYDTAMLLRLGPEKKPDSSLTAKIGEAEAALTRARAEVLSLQEAGDQATAGPEREKNLTAARQQLRRMQNELVALNDPAAHGPVAFGVRDARIIGDIEVRIRGEAEKLGPVVPRGFLSAFEVPDAPRINPSQSGRLELAHWLTSERNPLTARVMANRVWHHLFGQGLVTSVDNFGVTGDAPSHPELLDYLATQLMRNGWSIKQLIRTIVTSRAYQLSTQTTAAHLAADPGNRLVWRHSPRRLDAEQIRDAMLAAAGTLDHDRPNGSPGMEFKMMELRMGGPEATRLETVSLTSKHRSVYLPLLRGLTPRALEVFDFASQGMVTGSRDRTTVATQALYLLNDPFVRQQSLALADRLLRHSNLDDAGRISLVYQLTVGRPATASETERARSYLADYEAAAGEEAPGPRASDAWASFCQAILASAEFRYLR